MCKLGPEMLGYGASCTSADACASGLCARGLGNDSVCTRTCDAQRPCADGARCEQRDGRSVCVMAAFDGSQAAGCTVGANGAPDASLLLGLLALGLLALVGRRHRRSGRR